MGDSPTEEIIVITRSGCVQCRAAMRLLNRHDAKYCVVSLDDKPDAADRFKDLGISSLPVIHYGDETFGGFNPDRIAVIAAKQREDAS